ncbi:MAG: carbohydrate binding domain-containing protein [bacterium]|nr:carbohydrate binding domain-containing protein [bacterium]
MMNERPWKMGERIVCLLIICFIITFFLLPKKASAFSFIVDGTELAVNGGFETGDLTGWGSFGSATVQTTDVCSGTYAVKISNGGAVWQMINLPATFSVTSLNFSYKVSGSGGVIAFGVDQYGGYSEFLPVVTPTTGWENYSQDITPFLTQGDPFVVVGFAGDNAYVDATPSSQTNTVPEPCTLLLLGSGVVAIVIRRRKK